MSRSNEVVEFNEYKDYCKNVTRNGKIKCIKNYNTNTTHESCHFHFIAMQWFVQFFWMF